MFSECAKTQSSDKLYVWVSAGIISQEGVSWELNVNDTAVMKSNGWEVVTKMNVRPRKEAASQRSRFWLNSLHMQFTAGLLMWAVTRRPTVKEVLREDVYSWIKSPMHKRWRRQKDTTMLITQTRTVAPSILSARKQPQSFNAVTKKQKVFIYHHVPDVTADWL